MQPRLNRPPAAPKPLGGPTGAAGRPRPVYLDYHATTPVDPRVAAVVLRHMLDDYGNASSTDHTFGDAAAEAVDAAAAQVGALVGARAESVVFTSGATESINLAVQGLAAARRSSGPLRVAVSPTEHAAVLDTCRALARAGLATVRTLSVDGAGRVDLDEIEAACAAGLDLLCVMAANNEVGTIAPVGAVAAAARRHGVAYLCDGTQACGRVPLDVERDGITLLALSAHKMHGPKGVGALVVGSRRLVTPIIHGGGQQRGLRAGTLNTPGIAGFGEACRLRAAERDVDEPAIARRRDRLQDALLREVPEIVVNGDQAARLAGNLHVSFLGCPNAAVIARVRDRLAVATGSACASGIEAPSHVVRAMRLDDDVIDGAVRIGLGKWTTDADVQVAAAVLAEAVADTRRATCA